MGSNDWPPYTFMTFTPHAWDLLSDAVDDAVEQIKEDAIPGADNNWSPDEHPGNDAIAEMLEHMAMCYRNHWDFYKRPLPPRRDPDD